MDLLLSNIPLNKITWLYHGGWVAINCISTSAHTIWGVVAIVFAFPPIKLITALFFRLHLYRLNLITQVMKVPCNPKNILTLKILARPGFHILDVNGAGQRPGWQKEKAASNIFETASLNFTQSVKSAIKCNKSTQEPNL